MHKVRFYLLVMLALTPVVYAGDSDKENGKSNPLFDFFVSPSPGNVVKTNLSARRGSVGAPQQKIEDTKGSSDTINALTEKTTFLNTLVRDNEKKCSGREAKLYERIEATEEKISEQLDAKFSQLRTEAVRHVEKINTRLNSSVIERVPHDLQPDLDKLKEQFKELSEEVVAYEALSQSFAKNDDVEQIKSTYSELHKNLNELEKQITGLDNAQNVFAKQFEGVVREQDLNQRDYATNGALKEVDAKVAQQLKKATENGKEQLKKALKSYDQMDREKKINPITRLDQLNSRATNERVDALDGRVQTLENDCARKEDVKDFIKKQDLENKKYATANQVQQANDSFQQKIEALRTEIPNVNKALNEVDGKEDPVARASALKEVSESVTQQVAKTQSQVQVLSGELQKKSSDFEKRLQITDALIPTADNPKGLATQVAHEERAKGLEGQITEVKEIVGALDTRLDDCVTKKDIEGMIKESELNDYAKKDDLRERLQAGLKYFAAQSALGGVTYYYVSPRVASLLQSAGLENEYVELNTIAVPASTLMTSLIARLIKEGCEKGKGIAIQEVVKESVYDAGTSAAVMGLKSFFCDDQMCKEIDEKMSEKNRATVYAFSYGILRSILALLA